MAAKMCSTIELNFQTYSGNVFSSSPSSSELSFIEMRVSCAFPRTFRVERQLFPGMEQVCKGLAWLLRNNMRDPHVAPIQSRTMAVSWSHDFMKFLWLL
jgi:hypothetical protein